jgi:hypothetical protein
MIRILTDADRRIRHISHPWWYSCCCCASPCESIKLLPSEKAFFRCMGAHATAQCLPPPDEDTCSNRTGQGWYFPLTRRDACSNRSHGVVLSMDRRGRMQHMYHGCSHDSVRPCMQTDAIRSSGPPNVVGARQIVNTRVKATQQGTRHLVIAMWRSPARRYERPSFRGRDPTGNRGCKTRSYTTYRRHQ